MSRLHRLQTEFCQYSTLHGVSDIYRSKGTALGYFWLAVFAAGMGATIYGCLAIVNHYLRSPLVVSYFVYGNETLVLPDIIICPLNRLNKSLLDHYNVSSELAQYLELGFPYPFTEVSEFQKEMYQKIWKKIDVYDAEFSDLLKKTDKTLTQFIDEVTRFDCEALIIDHNIRNPHGARYHCSEFPSFRISSGTCFRIPGNVQNDAGFGHGARIKISLPRHQNLFNPGLNQIPANGIIVKFANFHSKQNNWSRFGNPVEGLDRSIAFIPAGVYSLISLKSTKYEFTNYPPVYECTKSEISEGYSEVYCFESCLIRSAEKICGCTPSANSLPKMPLCSTKLLFGCFYKELGHALDSRRSSCRNQCKPLCHYWKYTPTISYGTYPSPEMKTFVRDDKTKKTNEQHYHTGDFL